MAMTADQYLAQLQSLLPPGLAWTRDPSAELTQLLTAWADELARVDARGGDLLDEADPRTAFEMLADWERVTGLPDPCAPTASMDERRAALQVRLIERGGQSPAYFVALAEALGFFAAVEETRMFAVGTSAVGDKLWQSWTATPLAVGQAIGAITNYAFGAPYLWFVHSLRTSLRWFATGAAAVGEPLRSWGNAMLECAIRDDAPAHTRVEFVYDYDRIPANNTYFRAGDPAGGLLHTWAGPYTYKQSGGI